MKETTRVLGVDTGASGAAVLLSFKSDQSAEVLEFIDVERDSVSGCITADFGRKLSVLASRADQVAFEKVWAMPGQACKATWNQALVYGQMLYTLQVYNPVMIPAITWKTSLGLKAPKGSSVKERKEITRSAVSKQWPNLAPIVKRAKDDGRADAIMIAWYLNLTQRRGSDE